MARHPARRHLPKHRQPSAGGSAPRATTAARFRALRRWPACPSGSLRSFPISTHLARASLVAAGARPARAKAWRAPPMRPTLRRWGLDLSDAAVLRSVCAQAGLELDATEAVWNDPALKAQLKAENDAAPLPGSSVRPTRDRRRSLWATTGVIRSSGGSAAPGSRRDGLSGG